MARLTRLLCVAVLLMFAGPAMAAPVAIAAIAFWAEVITIGQLVMAVAAFAVSSILAKKAAGSYSAKARDRMQVVRSAVQPRRLIYGRTSVSGPLIYATSSGNKKEYMHMVIALATHELQSIDVIWLNDEIVGALDADGNVTTGRYAGFCRVRKFLGTADQEADPDLISDSGGQWTSAHRLQGIAYVYVRLKWNMDKFPLGLPNVRAEVLGKKVYDPRTETTAYSRNWALCVRDYLTSTYGLGCADDEIDDDSVIAAANISDEDVELDDLSPATTHKRYTMNGCVELSDRPRDIIAEMTSAAAGAVTWTNGRYRVFAGAYDAPVATLTVSDLRGAIEVQTRTPRQSLFNGVRGTYSDPDKLWQPGDFPPVRNPLYVEQDGGEEIFADLELPYVINGLRAQRLAKIKLEEARQGITVRWPGNLNCFKLAVWDTVSVTVDYLGWDAKVFRVMEWTVSGTGGVDLVLREVASTAWDWNHGEATVIDSAPDTNLPAVRDVSPPGVPTLTETLYQTIASAGIKTRAIVTWGESSDDFVVGYVFEYKLQELSDWQVFAPRPGTTVQIDDLAPGRYNMRVKAVNVLGVSSEYATNSAEVLGLSAAPADVTGFSVIASGGVALGAWDSHADLDVRVGGKIVIRHSPETVGASWLTSYVLDDFQGGMVSGVLPLLGGTYFAKAKDSAGQYSANAVSFVVSEANITPMTTVGSVDEHTAFTGAKNGVTIVSGAAGIQISLGGSPLHVLSSGTYDFANVLDLTTKAVRRFEAHLLVSQVDTNDLFDSDELFDSTEMFDGGSDINDCDVKLSIATTDDNPSGSPVTWSEWAPFFVGDFNCRAAKFMLELTSQNGDHNMIVIEAGVAAKVPT
ncbi:MAG TPA: hypothetical protein VJU83_09765 [Burkholderiales bacterium]|nr:hypothetical protein [Burkholderiales bacterium]